MAAEPEPLVTDPKVVDVIVKDRRVNARLSCEWGNCRWSTLGGSAASMDALWLKHSRTHWEATDAD